MHRFHVAPCPDGPRVALPEAEARHAARVLRVQPGERVTVLDGAGRQLLCEVRDVTRRDVFLAVIESKFIPPLPYQLTLIQAMPKGHKLDDIVEKATELGVARVVPLITERTITRLDAASAPGKLAKWRATAIESIKQCGSAWLPQIEAPVTLEMFLQRGEKFDLMLAASLQAGSRPPRDILQRHLAAHGRPRTVAVWVGPEGDFTPAEMDIIVAAGAQPMTLGPLVLRCETAAICSLAIVSCELQAA